MVGHNASLAAYEEQSSRGLSAVRALDKKTGKVELWALKRRGENKRIRVGGTDPSNFRAYNAVLAFCDSTLKRNFKQLTESGEL